MTGGKADEEAESDGENSNPERLVRVREPVDHQTNTITSTRPRPEYYYY